MAEQNNGKASCFFFDDECDLVLVRIVDMTEAHLASYSSVAPKWQGVRAMFMSSHEVTMRFKDRGCALPKWRSLQEHFKLIISKRRAHVKKMERPSGVYE